MDFKLYSEYKPTGDQPEAIEKLVNKPTLIISHNKTSAGQLYSEMKEFFPDNAVEFFVSQYDYEAVTTTYCGLDRISARYDVLKRHYGLYDMR